MLVCVGPFLCTSPRPLNYIKWWINKPLLINMLKFDCKHMSLNQTLTISLDKYGTNMITPIITLIKWVYLIIPNHK